MGWIFLSRLLPLLPGSKSYAQLLYVNLSCLMEGNQGISFLELQAWLAENETEDSSLPLPVFRAYVTSTASISSSLYTVEFLTSSPW